MKPFPAFRSHEVAASWGCIACGAKLDASKATDKGYPPGRGQYGIRCEKCESTRFYDLEKVGEGQA